MSDYDNMSADELTAERAQLSEQITALRAKNKLAGLALENKRASSPKAKALRKLQMAQDELKEAMKEEVTP